MSQPAREAPVGRTTRLAGLQRRVRALVPGPVRRADLWLFRRVAASPFPDAGRVLPRLSTAANRSVLWLTIAGLLAATGGRFGRRAGLRGVLAIAVTSAVTNLPAKLLSGRERPDLALVPEVRRLARVPTSTSFPSGHAASAFAFATAVSIEQPRLRVPMLTLASAVAASRVTTGVHYPGDVLAGAAIGAGIATATTGVWPRADRRAALGSPTEAADVLPGADGAGVVLVANTGAGNLLSERTSRALVRALPQVELLTVQAGEDLPAALRRAARHARVLAVAGGDGSASTAAAVALEAGIPLAVVPAGTLNHLASDLGVAQVAATVRAVQQGRAIRMDVGEVDGRIFVNAAAIGAYPEVVRQRERLEDRIGKWPAAVLVTLRVMMGHDPVEVEIDGRTRRVWQLFLGNGIFETAGIAPTYRSRLDDGLIDVRLLHAEVPWARTRMLASVLVGRGGRCASYERWTAREVDVRSPHGPLRIARDGETRMGGTSFVVRKRPRALVVMQPSPDLVDA